MPDCLNAMNTVAGYPIKTSAAAELRSTTTIRLRANVLLARARRGESAWFTVIEGAMVTTAALVARLTRARYPDLKISHHSRWQHFEPGGRDRLAVFNQRFEMARKLAPVTCLTC